MSRLYSLGELLIDFQSVGTSPLKDTREFIKNAGGAPANVCVQAVKLGQSATYLTKVGDDGFGEFLIETLKREGVDTSYITKSKEHYTSLAFVSLNKDGEREFSFYRKAAADLYFTAEDFKGVSFQRGDIFEFGSVALAADSAKDVHRALISRAQCAGAVVCFDPNLRFNLWSSADELRATVNEFLPYADIVKVGVEELEFITGERGREAVESVFKLNAKILLLTDGSNGARLYLKNGRELACKGHKVKAVDATGAGDSFFGGFLAQALESGLTAGELVNDNADYLKMLDFACKCGAYTASRYGAIAAMGNRKNIEKAVK